MGVGGAVGVGLDLADGLLEPCAVRQVGTVDVDGRHGFDVVSVLTRAHQRASPRTTGLDGPHDMPPTWANIDFDTP